MNVGLRNWVFIWLVFEIYRSFKSSGEISAQYSRILKKSIVFSRRHAELGKLPEGKHTVILDEAELILAILASST